MASFGDMLEAMDEQIMASFADATGKYMDPSTGQVHCGIELIVDHNLQQAGPDGLFLTDAVGLTWRRTALSCAARGGVFTLGPTRYTVEDIIADDGYMVTAACQVQP